jgi:hypothetical protein
MTFVSGHLISGADIATGVFVLTVFAAWAVMALLTVLALRRTGESGMKGALWGGGLVLGCVLLTSLLFERVLTRDLGAERRAIEARASELIAHAIAPGSALTCLDTVASVPVETACERALFATPEAVAAALAYVNARYSLLEASAALAARDPGYQPTVERLRRGIEEDRFGLVAQVLSTRGCNAPDCADFAVLRDSRRIVANMKDRTFAARVEVHALAWDSSGAASVLAAASPAPSSGTVTPPSGMALASPVTTEAGPAMPGTPATSARPGRVRYDYPSAASFPPISIMEPESDAPPVAETKTTPQKRPAPQAAHKRGPVAPPRATLLPPPPAVVPQPQPQPQTSGTR